MIDTQTQRELLGRFSEYRTKASMSVKAGLCRGGSQFRQRNVFAKILPGKAKRSLNLFPIPHGMSFPYREIRPLAPQGCSG